MTTDATADSGGAAASIPTPSCDAGADRPLFYVLYKEGTQQYFIEQAQGAAETAGRAVRRHPGGQRRTER